MQTILFKNAQLNPGKEFPELKLGDIVKISGDGLGNLSFDPDPRYYQADIHEDHPGEIALHNMRQGTWLSLGEGSCWGFMSKPENVEIIPYEQYEEEENARRAN